MNDHRKHEPIQNVIDPDLFAYRLDRNMYVKILEDKLSKKGYGNEKRLQILQDNDKKNMFIRGTYQWIPAIFREYGRNTEKSHVKCLTNVHSLLYPKKKFPQLYECIEQVLTYMLPLFQKFNDFANRESDEFQCVVKSQRYGIQPNTGYAGHWHVEGLTENIRYVGLYYWEWDDALSGGNMKFRPLVHPQRCYMDNYVLNSQQIYNTETFDDMRAHSAIVFDNTAVAHR
ncbi:hypothetical protein RFI_01734, partial [Reticulomyxa filosa]